MNIYGYDPKEIQQIGDILSLYGFYTYIVKLNEDAVKEGMPPFMVIISKEGPKENPKEIIN